MKLYLIRHGQTLLNQSNVHQYSTTPLSEKGLLQAEVLARRLEHAHIDRIYSSPMLRAQQTAQVISKYSKKELITLDELREVKRPSQIEGRTHTDPVVLEIKKKLKENAHQMDWHYSDEENFFDVKKRVLTVMKSLEKHEDDSILLVTHGTFIKMFLAVALFEEDLTLAEFENINATFEITNTGITEFELQENSFWKIVTVNDTTHL